MLILTRKAGESILIGDDIEIRISRIEGDLVKIGIAAPRSVSIVRKEVVADIAATNERAALPITPAAAGGSAALPKLPALPKLGLPRKS